MKNVLSLLLFTFALLVGDSCNSESIVPTDKQEDIISVDANHMNNIITIKVGDKAFTATLNDNASAAAFTAMLPMIINMNELNGNEKYFRLSENLPTHASTPGTINTGDLMLWGSNTLVIFYETFSTSYNYTKLGKIDNPTGLASALGSGNVVVTIEINQK